MAEVPPRRRGRRTNAQIQADRHTAIGWSEDVYDICWLACPEDGYRRVSDGGHQEIVLCRKHIDELEETSNKGYRWANPPQGYDEGVWWPWQEVSTTGLQFTAKVV